MFRHMPQSLRGRTGPAPEGARIGEGTAVARDQLGSVVVLGEALVDLLPAENGSFVPVAGGGPANTAVGLARLGVPVELLCGISGGRLGDLIRDSLTASGVATSGLRESSLPPTLAVVDSPADPRFSLYTSGTAGFDVSAADLPELGPGVAAVHAASLALFVEPSATAALTLVERSAGRRLVSLDPNIRPGASGEHGAVRARFEQLCASADIVRLSDADCAWLYPDLDGDGAVAHLLDHGPALVVLTLGGNGATAATRSAGARLGPRTAKVVDTVGAGDTVNAAVLAHCLSHGIRSRAELEGLTDDGLAALLGFALAAAAITCSRAGADPPWARELSGG